MNTKTDTRKWGWSLDEMAFGPFESRQDAISDAVEHSLGGFVWVGRMKTIDPAEWLPSLPDLIDEMENRICDNAASFDDYIIDVRGGKREADSEANNALTAWAEKYLFSSCWYLVDCEEVSLRAGEKP